MVELTLVGVRLRCLELRGDFGLFRLKLDDGLLQLADVLAEFPQNARADGFQYTAYVRPKDRRWNRAWTPGLLSAIAAQKAAMDRVLNDKARLAAAVAALTGASTKP